MNSLALKRFEAKYVCDLETGCWNWIAGGDSNGYGRFWYDGSMKLPHRLSWEMINGKIDAGKFACHKCDNPRCINPDHLFIGTQRDNIQDCIKKKRFITGEKNGASKIPNSEMGNIREMLRQGKSNASIGRMYGVTRESIRTIKIGKTRKNE